MALYAYAWATEKPCSLQIWWINNVSSKKLSLYATLVLSTAFVAELWSACIIEHSRIASASCIVHEAVQRVTPMTPVVIFNRLLPKMTVAVNL